MKIFQIVPDISYEANGVTPVINGLSSYFVQRENQVSVCALGAMLSDPKVEFLKARQPKLFKLNEYSFDFSKYLKNAFEESDIVHGHGLWSAANLLTGIYARKRRAKLVISPHGTLTEYALSRRRIIKKFLWPVQRLSLTRADLLHATAESEVEDIRRVGYQGPVALIPNGIKIPQISIGSSGTRKKQVLFLSRIHPIKGLENLLRAWLKVWKSYPEWELVIAGVGMPEYETSLKELANSLKLQRVKWVGPVYGVEKEMLYRDSSLFILPSHSENFGMVVAEAMSYGLPCIVSKGAPWSVLEESKAGWWVENDIDALTLILIKAFSITDKDLESMGLHGRIYVEEHYSWSYVGSCFNDTYNWLLGNGQRQNYILS